MDTLQESLNTLALVDDSMVKALLVGLGDAVADTTAAKRDAAHGQAASSPRNPFAANVGPNQSETKL